MDCIDLRPWAKAHRYRFRLEESYEAERPEYRGDGRWYVEILCRGGLIYPHGLSTLLAYVNFGAVSAVAKVSGAALHQSDGKAQVFRFPADRLDEVAAILKPKRLRGSANLTLEQRANLQEGRKRLEKSKQTAPGIDANSGLREFMGARSLGSEIQIGKTPLKPKKIHTNVNG